MRKCRNETHAVSHRVRSVCNRAPYPVTFYVEYDWLGVLLVIINAAAWHYIFKRFLL